MPANQPTEAGHKAAAELIVDLPGMVPGDQSVCEPEKERPKMASALETLLESNMASQMNAHASSMTRIEANAESASNIVRHAGAKALAEKDAEESKGAEQILSAPAKAA